MDKPAIPHAERDTDLDLIRGIAILLAMGWHANHATGNAVADLILAPGRLFGWAGVDLFFVLSGFLVGRLILKEYQLTGGFDYRRFFIRRAFKLWPVLYTFLLFMTIADWHEAGQFVWQIGLHVQNYFVTPVATHLWSLAVEEHFYLMAAVLILIFTRVRLNPDYLIFFLIALMLVVPVLRFVAASLGVTPANLQIQTQYRLDGLSCGVLLAAISLFKPSLFERAVRQKLLFGLLSLAGYVLLAFMQKGGYWGSTIGFSLSYLAGAALFMAIYRSQTPRYLPVVSRGLAFIGVYSYALYLWHVPVIKIIDLVQSKFDTGVPSPLITLCKYIVAIAFAFVVTRLVERPSLRLRERLFPSRVEAI